MSFLNPSDFTFNIVALRRGWERKSKILMLASPSLSNSLDYLYIYFLWREGEVEIKRYLLLYRRQA